MIGVRGEGRSNQLGDGMKRRITMAAALVGLVFTRITLGGTDMAAKEPCAVARIASEFAVIKAQRLKCEENDELPFCEDAEDYELALSAEEAMAAWKCLEKQGMEKAFVGASFPGSIAYRQWPQYSKSPYTSAHANRFVDDTAEQAIYVINFANETARPYGKYEESGAMPAGAILAKYSMVLTGEGGRVELAPAYTMKKLAAGSSPKTLDWAYDMLIPAALKAPGRAVDLAFTQADCAGCHMQYGKETDSMLFMPEEGRVTSLAAK